VKQLYFVRHGESELNKAGKWAGSTDTPLTPKGHEQAKQTGLAARIQGLTLDVIVSSPLQRARHTAQHIARQINYPEEAIIIEPRLVERSFGKLENTRDLVARAKYVANERAIDSYPEVESLEDLHVRAAEVLEYLHSLPYNRILIVGHGASGRALRRVINNEPSITSASVMTMPSSFA